MFINQSNINKPTKPPVVDANEKLKQSEYSVDKENIKRNDNEHCMTKSKTL
jgi:hypothetical protein